MECYISVLLIFPKLARFGGCHIWLLVRELLILVTIKVASGNTQVTKLVQLLMVGTDSVYNLELANYGNHLIP